MKEISVLGLLVAAVMCAQMANWRHAFEDSLTGEPGGAWTWVREQANARRTTPQGLELRMLSGTLWAKDNTAGNLLVRPLPAAEPVRTEVTLTNEPGIMNEQAGLIWYAGDDDYIKLVKEMKEQPYIILGREERQAAKTFGRIAMPSVTVSLRLTSDNGRVVAHARTPESDWQLVGECAPIEAKGLRGGIFASVAPGEADRWVRFSGFRILTPER